MATADSREEGQPRSAAALFRHAYDKRWGVYCPLECAGPSELAACAQDLRAASGRPPLMKPVDRHEAVLLLRQLQQEGGDATPLGPVLCSQAGSAQLARLLALFVPNTAPQEAQPPLSGRAFLDQIRNSACTAEDRLVLEALRAPGHAPVDMSSTDQSASGARSMPDSAGAHACSNDQHSDSSTPNFPDGGVTVNIMEGILRDERIAADSTTDIVCHTIIKPATVPPGWEEIVTPVAKPWGTLYQATYKNLTTGKLQSTPPPGTSCLCDKLMAAGHRGAGKANVFFSHAWKFKFVDVVAAMRTFVDREAELGHTETFYFWFDTVVVDEHASQSFPPEWWETAFAEAVACIGHTCLMMTPWNAPIVITRAWCLWEVYCTMKAEKEQGCRFTLALSPIEQAALLSALARDGVDAVLKPFAAIDCRKAQATNPDDLSKILAAIRAGPGYDQLNAAVLERQRVWVMDTVSTYLQDVEIRGETRDRNTCCLMLRHVELLLEMGQLAEAYTVCATSLEIAGGLSLEFADGIPTGRFISTTESGGVLDSPDDVIILQLQMCIVRVTKMDTLKLIELVHTLMESFERVCGASHELTLSAQAQLASAQLTRAKALTRKPTEARLIFEELIPGMVSVLGPQHKKTLSAMNTYGGILGDQYYQEQMARPIFQATVDGYLATMGPSHPNTLTARANLARTLEQLGETETAQREYELVLAGDIVQLGEDHLSCLQDRFNLAMLLKNSKTGKLEAAISLLQQCVDGALRNPDIGKNHEFTIFVTSLLKQWAAAVSKFTQSQRIATGADSTGQHGNSITPELLPVSETWVRFTCNDRCFYVHKSTKKSLTAPAEGITTDIAVGDPRIPISEEYFEQHFTHLVARQRKVDANLLNPDSSWVKYTNSGCEFQLMRLTGHAGNPYYERRFEQPHQQQLHPPTEGVYDDIDGNHPDAPSDSDFVETVRTLIDEKRRAAALTDGLGPASAHRRAQHGRPVRSYVPGAAVQQPKFATFMWGCPFPADSTQTYQVRVNDDDSPMVKATTLNDTQTPCLLSLTVGFPEGEIDCFAYRAWRAYELKNAVHAAAILVENHSSPELTGLYKLVEHSYVKKDVCYKKESPQMFFYYNFIVKKWLVSKTFCSAESTDACCFLSCEDGLSVPAGSRKWRGKVNKAWQDVRMTVSELATQEDLADCKKRLQDKAIAEKAAAAAEKAAAAAAAAAARQQASELVAFVIEEHLHPKMNGVYSKMGEHKGFPYYQNTNGVYCYRYVSANKWFIRQDKFEPDSAVRNSEISATDGPLPVGTQQWTVWSNGADVVHKVKVSTLATQDALRKYHSQVAAAIEAAAVLALEAAIVQATANTAMLIESMPVASLNGVYVLSSLPGDTKFAIESLCSKAHAAVDAGQYSELENIARQLQTLGASSKGNAVTGGSPYPYYKLRGATDVTRYLLFNKQTRKWMISNEYTPSKTTCFASILSEAGLIPISKKSWQCYFDKTWQARDITVSGFPTKQRAEQYLQDKAIAEKAAAAAAAAAARQQASELVAFVIEEHLHPKMNGVYSKMGEHKGFPYYQNTNGVYCYRYVSANKWFIRQDKFEPDSAVRNSEISATDGPLPVGTQQWMVWSNGADVVHKVKVSTLATVDSLQEYEQCVRDKMAADRERATRALEESFTAQERNGLVGLRHIRGPPDAVSIASDRTITFSKSFATVGSPQVLGNDQLTHFFEVVLVKMPPAGVGALQIGWAAADFDTTVRTNTSSGVGDDEYSWSIDGIRGRVYGTGAISSFKESEWKQGDVVGCGITSSGELIFGRNGKYDTPLGIAFQHVCAKHGLFPAISGSTKSGELVVRPNYGDRHPPFRYASPNLGKFNLRHFKPIQSSFYSKRRSLVKFFRYDVEGNQLAVPGSGHAYWPPAESVFEQHVTEYATKLGEDHEMTLTLKWKLALLKFGCNPYQWVDHPDSDVSGFDVSDLRCAVKLLLEIVDSATRNGEITEQSRHDGPRSLEAGFNPCRPSQYKFWLAKWEEVLGRRQSIDELQRAPGSFVQGVSVTWTGHDNDIPAGSVGEVIGYNQKGCRVKFPNGTWTFKNEQLRPVTADPAAAKSSSVEPASNMDGGVDEIDEAATIPVSLAGADRLFEQHLDRMSLHRIRQLADPARAIAQTPRFCAGTVEAERQHVLDGMITRLESYGWQVRGFVERLWELGAEVPREQLIAADIDAASRHLLGRILDDTVDAVVARPSSMFKNAERLFERDPVSFRRILQLANPGAALGQVPRFCMGTIEAERQHALNGIIAQLEANGWQVRRSIERLWELGAEAPREQLIMADVDAASRHLLERILASCDSRSGPVTAIAADQAAAKPTTAESVEQLVALGFDAAAAASALGAAGGDVQVAANMLLQ